MTEILKKGGKINYLGRLENVTEQHKDPDPDPKEKNTKRKSANQRSQNQSPRQQGTNPRNAQPAAELPFVEGLDRKSWEAYEAYRRQTKRKKLQPTSVTRLQRWLSKQPDQAAVVDQTIRNGWTGLFELKARPKKVTERPQSFQGMVEDLGRKLGVPPRPGEDWKPYYDRLRAIQQRPH